MSQTSAVLLTELPDRLSDVPRRWARQSPLAPAVLAPGLAWNYQQLAHAIDQAQAFLTQLEVRPGDRVMVVGENCAAQVALLFALASMDAWSVNINARLSAGEIGNIYSHCAARRVIFTTAVSAEASAHALRFDAQEHRLPLLGPLMVSPQNENCTAEPVAASGSEQVAALIYTTGTTGHPKGVMLTHRNLLFIAAVSGQLRGVQPNDRVYGVLPMSHVYGLASVLLGTFYAGACLLVEARYSPQAMISAIRDHGLTMLQGVPAMYARLLDFDRQGWTAAGSALRFIYAGGSPLDQTLKNNVEALFGQPLHNGYGMTETSPTISQTRPGQPRQDTSVGTPIPGIEIRLVDAAGVDVVPGEPGELWVRGPNVMQGYYREAELTAQTMRQGGWLNTGDVARQAPDGALFIVGRTKELIIRSGFNVYPVEVEAAINAHPAVTQSAVVGRSVADGNEEVVAFVEATPGQALEAAGLRQFLAQRLSPYKLPNTIVFMPTLPAAATGKILKGQLQQLAQRMDQEFLTPGQ
ncbi:MAG: AMP-binding protein [Rhodoferax sp.]|nr:AMP-binding protein [Rhodoferax sp.]